MTRRGRTPGKPWLGPGPWLGDRAGQRQAERIVRGHVVPEGPARALPANLPMGSSRRRAALRVSGKPRRVNLPCALQGFRGDVGLRTVMPSLPRGSDRLARPRWGTGSAW